MGVLTRDQVAELVGQYDEGMSVSDCAQVAYAMADLNEASGETEGLDTVTVIAQMRRMDGDARNGGDVRGATRRAADAFLEAFRQRGIDGDVTIDGKLYGEHTEGQGTTSDAGGSTLTYADLVDAVERLEKATGHRPRPKPKAFWEGEPKSDPPEGPPEHFDCRSIFATWKTPIRTGTDWDGIIDVAGGEADPWERGVDRDSPLITAGVRAILEANDPRARMTKRVEAHRAERAAKRREAERATPRHAFDARDPERGGVRFDSAAVHRSGRQMQILCTVSAEDYEGATAIAQWKVGMTIKGWRLANVEHAIQAGFKNDTHEIRTVFTR